MLGRIKEATAGGGIGSVGHKEASGGGISCVWEDRSNNW